MVKSFVCWLPGLVQEPMRFRCRSVAAIVSALLKSWHHGSSISARDAVMSQITSFIVE
jgi:hypothetical protein